MLIHGVRLVLLSLLFLAASAFPLRGVEPAAAPDPTALTRAVASDLGAARLDAVFARFDATMKAALPKEKLTAFWTGLTAQVGVLKTCAAPRLSPSGDLTVAVAACTFERQTLDLKLAFRRSGGIAGLFVLPAAAPEAVLPPAAYVRTGTFREKETIVVNGAISLPGTLSIPEGPGPFPGVVLVQGSGPHDRDETIGPNKPFRDLGQGLASLGIAVLRYEKRTKVAGQSMGAVFTVKEETVDDALAAVKLLRATASVDPGRVFVLGHSLGGMLAPRIGAGDAALAGLVVLAGNTRSLPELLREQADVVGSPEVKKWADEIEAISSRAEDGPAEVVAGAPKSYWRDLAGYRPAERARSLAKPFLILQGERDYQVGMKDFEGWRKALAGRADVVLKSYPKLNHLFMEGEGKSSPAEYQRAGHVAGEVVKDIAEFIKGTPAAQH